MSGECDHCGGDHVEGACPERVPEPPEGHVFHCPICATDGPEARYYGRGIVVCVSCENGLWTRRMEPEPPAEPECAGCDALEAQSTETQLLDALYEERAANATLQRDRDEWRYRYRERVKAQFADARESAPLAPGLRAALEIVAAECKARSKQVGNELAEACGADNVAMGNILNQSTRLQWLVCELTRVASVIRMAIDAAAKGGE